jgi:chemotaxis protein MotB
MLSVVSSVLRNTPNDIKIEGFATPNDAWGSAYPSNWELSSARASMVARYLTTRERIDGKRITVVGNAHYQPYDDAVPENFMNRRVEITIMGYGGTSSETGPSILDEPKE